MNLKIPKSNLNLFTDGAAKGNPGPAGAGIYLLKDNNKLVNEGFYLGDKTNNQAEYIALLIGLTYAREYIKEFDILNINLDSELIVKQLLGQYKVKNPILLKLYNMILKLLPNKFTVKHIYRSNNSIADKLANIGIEKRIKIPQDILIKLDCI